MRLSPEYLSDNNNKKCMKIPFESYEWAYHIEKKHITE